MLVDYHTHTSLCKHAEGTADDYIRRALELGLDEVGCSEHSPMPDGFDLQHRMTAEQFENEYAPKVTELRDRNDGRIAVRRGLEADFFPGTEEWVRDFIAKYDFDYVIGSVHFLGTWGFDNAVFVHHYEERNVDEVYEQYFEAVRQSARCGLFDIIAHCDLVKKFGHRPSKDMTGQIRETMSVIRDSGMCIEINTSGLRKPVREVYPSEQILAVAREFGVPITLGSDAHHPDDVARDFHLAVELIERYAGGRISVFEQRQRREERITTLKSA
jgi:histidinol-phosphatase (PHP family)